MPPLTDPLSSPPKSQFLADALAALSKRRKAIRNKVRKLSVEKVLERTDGDEWEKLEVTCDDGLGQRLRLFLWEDRWIFIDARASAKKGWAWEFTEQGRLVGGLDARALVEALEASLEASFQRSSASMKQIWTPLLTTGPRLVS